jgi:glycosyltransferase involved in cell wall biosynthesis
MGAAPNRLFYFAKRFAEMGHSVTVLTALPNYPEGAIFAGYGGRWIMEEHIEGIRVIRAWIYATKSKGLLRRLANYFSFMFSSVLLGIRRVGEQDVVIVESPPLFLGLAGLVYKLAKRAKLVFNVSDLWPASAIAMGMVRNRWAIKASVALEGFLYHCSDLITGQTKRIVQDIQTRVPEKPVELITNGIDVEGLPEYPTGIAERKRIFGWQGKFIVGYAGVHGLAQRLETVVAAAELLCAQPEITFVLFGDGPDKDKLVTLAGSRKLSNIRFYPPQPKAQILDIVSCFDVALVPLRKLDLFHGALPSKMFEAMGVGVPVVASVLGEARAVLDEAGGGISVQPEDPQGIAYAILRLYKDPSLRETLGAKARQYVIQKYNRADIARNYERLILKASELPDVNVPVLVNLQGAKRGADVPQSD